MRPPWSPAVMVRSAGAGLRGAARQAPRGGAALWVPRPVGPPASPYLGRAGNVALAPPSLPRKCGLHTLEQAPPGVAGRGPRSEESACGVRTSVPPSRLLEHRYPEPPLCITAPLGCFPSLECFTISLATVNSFPASFLLALGNTDPVFCLHESLGQIHPVPETQSPHECQ